jgi:signal transduction histidine kinase
MESSDFLRAQLQRRNAESGDAGNSERELHRRKTQLVARINEELRTPLSLILGPLETLLEHATNLTEAQTRDLQMVRRNAAVLLKHVNDLLDISRLDGETMLLNFSEVDLAALVAAIALRFESLARNRNIEWQLEIPQSLAAEIDPDKIERVLLNLLSNAFRFVPAGGHISCALSKDDTSAVIEVCNSGAQLNSEARPATFEGLLNGETGLDPAFEGVGLRLAIAREFIDLHRGTLQVDDAPGGGMACTVRIPLKAPDGVTIMRANRDSTVQSSVALTGTLEELRQPTGATLAAIAASGKPVLLLVEDHPEMRKFVSDNLLDEFQIVTAADGYEGLARAGELTPDVIVTDIVMPRMSGDRMIQALRSRREFDDVPIIVLSEKANDTMRALLLAAGAQDYVIKPFTTAELLSRIRNLVAIRRAKVALQNELASKSHDLAALTREVILQKRDLEFNNRLTEEFLATVSHELRTPLTSIYGWAQVLAKSGLDEQGRGRALEVIERNARLQLALVEDLLDMSRIMNGKLKLDIRHVDLPPVIDDLIQTTRLAADAKRISIGTVLDPAAGPVLGDPNRLRQVILNLLNNALKFTPAGGSITLSVQRVASHVEVSVSDTGCGITSEFLPYLFDRFRQQDGSDTRRHGGLGLGLTIVKSLVELHGGSIAAASDGAGRGARFTVRLPLLGFRISESDARPRAPLQECDLRGLRVLVVEDNIDTLELLTTVLKDHQPELKTCTRGDDALETIAGWQPHVLVCDIGLPGIHGYEVVRAARKIRRKNIVCLAFTAHASAADGRRALDAGFDAHLVKPVTPSEFITVLAKLIQNVPRVA